MDGFRVTRETWKEMGVWNGIDYGDLYMISSHGRVISLHDPFNVKYIKINTSKQGKLSAIFRYKGGVKRVLINRLVCSLFRPNIFGFETVKHLDGDKSNVAYWNLLFVNEVHHFGHRKDIHDF